MTAVSLPQRAVDSDTPQTSPPSSRSAFVELPLELRQAIYGYVLESDRSSPGSTKIELNDEATFTGSELDICLRLHWHWFLLNRQIVREGVQCAFRWSKVRFVGGPWVIWKILQRIQNLGPRKYIAHDDASQEEDDPRALNVASTNPKVHQPAPSPPRESLRPPLLPLLRHIELIWTTLPHDLAAPFILSRISTFELHPLFLFLATSLPNLTTLTITLRFRSTRDTASPAPLDTPLSASQSYAAELASYGLALLLCSAKLQQQQQQQKQQQQQQQQQQQLRLHTLLIRYAPRSVFASLSPPFPLRALTPASLPSLPPFAAALRGLRDWGFNIGPTSPSLGLGVSNLDISVTQVPWDPLVDADMVGEEALVAVRVREGREGVGVPEGGMAGLGRRPGWLQGAGTEDEDEWGWGDWGDFMEWGEWGEWVERGGAGLRGGEGGDEAYGELLRRVYRSEGVGEVEDEEEWLDGWES